MTRRIVDTLGALAALLAAASCKEDPTASLAGGAARLRFEYSYREVVIADSVRTYAIVRDAAGDPVPATVSLTSLDPTIAVIGPASDAPQLRQAFYLKGLKFGTTTLVASSGSLADTMSVATFPATIFITTGPDTILSGAAGSYGYLYRDARNNLVSGVPAPTWSTSDTTKAKVPAPAVATVKGRAPGSVKVIATGTGSPAGGITTNKPIIVIPSLFAGTISANSGVTGDTIILTNPVGGPGFDKDTKANFLVGNSTFPTFTVVPDTLKPSNDSLRIFVPGIGQVATFTVLMDGMGPEQISQKFTFDVTSTSLLDHQDPASDDPSTAYPISGNGDYFMVLHGTCTGGSVTDPGDDCDDFSRVANPSATDTLFAKVQLDWFTGSDVDILWCRNVICTSVTSGGGATSNNPEKSSVKIPPGATWYLWINLFDPAGATAVTARARVTGFP